MISRTSGSMKKPEKLKHVEEMGPNWVVIVGGAFLCTLSIRLCCKLKQIFDFKSSRKAHPPSKEKGDSTCNKRHESYKPHSQLYCIIQDEDGCQHCCSGAKHTPISPLSKDVDDSLPLLVKVASAQSYIDNGVMWASAGDRPELPPKPFNRTNSSDSPCMSESGSDIYIKRDVIQKLRRQLKRRDDMVLEMQSQITALQNSLTVQKDHTSQLQARVHLSNENLLDSDREIKWLQKTVYGMRASECARTEVVNGHVNGSVDMDLVWVGVEKIRGEDRIEMLKREIEELNEVIEGKEFLVQSYREQKVGLDSKLNELQQKLVSHASAPNIL